MLILSIRSKSYLASFHTSFNFVCLKQHNNVKASRCKEFLCYCVYSEQVNQELEINKTSSFKTLFWINDAKTYTKSEGRDDITSIGLLF